MSRFIYLVLLILVFFTASGDSRKITKVKKIITKVDRTQFPSINNFKPKGLNLTNLEYVIIQEKLDGCNFRVIYNRVRGKYEEPDIKFGSRTVLFDNQTVFYGYQRIQPQLIAGVRALSNYDQLRGKSFIVFGELIGYNEIGNPITGRYTYFTDTNVIKFFAYEIFVENNDEKVTPTMDEINKVSKKTSVTSMEFFQTQKLLKKAKFDVIPYTVLNASDYSYEKIIDFKSIYFNHCDYTKMEGYVLRFKFSYNDFVLTFKLKPENLEEYKTTTTFSPFLIDKKKNSKIDDGFLDYISKVPYLDSENKLINSSYVEICMREYQKEANIFTKKEFGRFYNSLSMFCREKPDYTELFQKFNELVTNGNAGSGVKIMLVA